MKVMILAAGRGERMRPLTDKIPKPLLLTGGKPLIYHAIERLVAAGFFEIVINIAHLGQQIKNSLGNGQAMGVKIEYSDEGESGLETAGGIIKALPLLGKQPFLVVNGDIACDFPLATLKEKSFDLAHLVMVRNPPHHPQGDFVLSEQGRLSVQGADKLTYSGIGLYHPQLFNSSLAGKVKLGSILRLAMPNQRISGEFYSGFWIDVGTPQRLKELNDHYQQRGHRHARSCL